MEKNNQLETTSFKYCKGEKQKRKLPRSEPVAKLDINSLKDQFYFDHQVYGEFLPSDISKELHLQQIENKTTVQQNTASSKKNNNNNKYAVTLYNNNLNLVSSNQMSRSVICDRANKDSSSRSQKFIDWIFSRRFRRRFVLLFVAALCFLFGIAVAVIFSQLNSNYLNNAPSIGQFSETKKSYPKQMNPLRNAKKLEDFKLDETLRDLFISIKTTKKYHHPRLVILLETWVSLVKAQTWFFTDLPDEGMQKRSSGHLVPTNCSSTHSRTALACKMAAEYDHFLKSHKSWWCHFDDDNYVHITRLAQLLKSHDPTKPKYLGKPSTAKPLEVFDIKAPQNTSHFWFATGGAGFCISRTLALKMAPFAANGKFVETGDKFWFPDDVTLGYIIEHLLGEKLTVVPEFHSHLEPMMRIGEKDIDDQISFSYINYNGVANVINLQGPFPTDADPTRFYSLHCRLYNAPYCPEE